MKISVWFILALAAAGTEGCASNKVQRAPSLVAVPSAAPAAPKRDLLKEAGDTTWGVVTAPARLVVPPKKAAPREQEVYEAPAAVIIQRRYVDEDEAGK